MAITKWHEPTCRGRGYARCCRRPTPARDSRGLELFALLGGIAHHRWRIYFMWGPVVCNRADAIRAGRVYTVLAETLGRMFVEREERWDGSLRPLPDVAGWSVENRRFLAHAIDEYRKAVAYRERNPYRPLIPVAEAALMLGYSPQHVRRLARVGGLGPKTRRLPTGDWACDQWAVSKLRLDRQLRGELP